MKNQSAAKLNTDLLKALKIDDFDSVYNLIQEGADINIRGEGNLSILNQLILVAPEDNDKYLPIFDLLIEKGIDVNHVGEFGLGPVLKDAIARGKLATADILLKLKDIDINKANALGETALLAAIEAENYELADRLIGIEAQINPAKDSYHENTPLTMAIAKADSPAGIEFVNKLIDLGADLNPLNSGPTPFSLLISKPISDEINALFFRLTDKGAEINPTNVNATTTPLISAIMTGDIGTVKDLVNEFGADVNLFNKHLNANPLLTALNYNRSNEVLEFILEKTDFTKTLPENCPGYLATAFALGDDELITKLLEIEGIDISSTNEKGESPLYLAITKNKLSITEKLLQMGAIVDSKKCPVTTCSEMFNLVKKYIPNANIGILQVLDKSNESVNSLLAAIKDMNPNAVKEIIKKEGVDIINKHPILFKALEQVTEYSKNKESIEILDYLLNIEGINPNVCFAKESLGKLSLLESALTAKNQSVANKLIELGATSIILGDNCNLIFNNKLLAEYIVNNNEKALNISHSLKQEKVDYKTIINLLQSIIADGHNPTLQAVISIGGQELIKAINDSGRFKEFKKIFNKNGIKYYAKYHTDEHDFIITSTDARDEYSQKENVAEIKKDSKTCFKDGKVCLAKTGEVIENSGNIRYVVSKKGVLYIDHESCNTGFHTYFLKGKFGDELFGYGKPVACAGNIKIEKGKITKLDGSSGHYCPTPDQIKVIASYFSQEGVLAENAKVEWYDENSGKDLFNDITAEVMGQTLDQYAIAEY